MTSSQSKGFTYGRGKSANDTVTRLHRGFLQNRLFQWCRTNPIAVHASWTNRRPRFQTYNSGRNKPMASLPNHTKWARLHSIRTLYSCSSPKESMVQLVASLLTNSPTWSTSLVSQINTMRLANPFASPGFDLIIGTQYETQSTPILFLF